MRKKGEKSFWNHLIKLYNWPIWSNFKRTEVNFTSSPFKNQFFPITPPTLAISLKFHQTFTLQNTESPQIPLTATSCITRICEIFQIAPRIAKERKMKNDEDYVCLCLWHFVCAPQFSQKNFLIIQFSYLKVMACFSSTQQQT